MIESLGQYAWVVILILLIVMLISMARDAWPKCTVCGKREWSHKTRYHRFAPPKKYRVNAKDHK